MGLAFALGLGLIQSKKVIVSDEDATTEDLSTYTSVDPESNFTITPTKVTVTVIHPEHTTTYLYKDFGAGYFKRNFEIRFGLNVSAIWTAHALQGIIGVTNNLGLGNAVEGPNVEINYDYDGDGTRYELQVGGGDHVAHSYIDQFLWGALVYYCKFERVYVGGATNNIAQLTVYSDSNYTVLAKKITTSPVGGNLATWGEGDFTLAEATEEFRYLMLATSSRASYSDTESGSFEISNVEIISNTD
jgi:hypothetical protein